MKTVSEKQLNIYEFIVSFTEANGYPPSVREIASAVGLKSPSTVHFHLKTLEEAGYIRRGSGKNRTITPLMGEDGEAAPKPNSVPLVGDVAAGFPILAQENIEGYLPYDCSRLSGDVFALRIRGDSMINAGILPGDKVIVRSQNTAENGEIVIALLGDEATCKRFSYENGRLLLLPENDAYPPIDGTDAVILGIVVGLVREY